MITKKKAMLLTSESENLVYVNMEVIFQLIQLHAELGMSEMEIFVDKKKSQKYAETLRKNKFYCRIIEFKALKDECRLYVSWISNL
jgi:hypothetical protein